MFFASNSDAMRRSYSLKELYAEHANAFSIVSFSEGQRGIGIRRKENHYFNIEQMYNDLEF